MQEAQDKHPATRRIDTQQFGELELEDRHIFTFKDGLHGFQELHKFVVVGDDSLLPFKWLLSLEQPSIGFPLLSPYHIDFAYSPDIEFNPQTSAIMVIVTLADPKQGTPVANMRAPLLLDVQQQTGQQLLLNDSVYAMEQPVLSTKKSTTKRIYTTQFGVLDILPEQVIVFGEGMLGFPELREFVLIAEEQSAPLSWLVSVEDPTIGFPLISPWLVHEEYDLRGQFDASRHSAHVVVTLGSSADNMTVNLKAPIIVDAENQTGKQLILVTEKYSTEFRVGSCDI